MRSKLFIDFSSDDQNEFAFDELIRTLHGAPLFVKPAVGNSPFTPVVKNPPERQGDAILELMKTLVGIFEMQNVDYIDYSDVRSRINISRLMLDILIEQAKEEGLLTQGASKLIYLTTKGKQYALFHKITH